MIKLPFTNLSIWQKGMQLAHDIYQIAKKFPKEELFGITSQMRRSSLSIPSNIAEGSQRSTDKDFAHFISMARGSLAELQTQSIFSYEENYISESEHYSIQDKIIELSKMLRSFYKKLTADR